MSPKQQTYEINGPDGRIRGNAYQVLEKYLALARDAASAGDRIAAENYYQHAEHYYRVINANGGEQGGHNGRNRYGYRPDGGDAPAGDGPAEPSADPRDQPRRGRTEAAPEGNGSQPAGGPEDPIDGTV
jgi:hypothetical protein